MERTYPKVMVIGVGRVGHACLHLLASEGFSEFVLLDHDRVEAKNIPDTRYRQGDVGKRKVDAAAELSLRANPGAKVKVFNYPVQETDFSWLLSRAGLLGGSVAIFAFDDPGALLIANQRLYAQFPICFPGLHAQARTGHVIYTVPGITPCIACAMGEGAQNVRRPLRQLRPEDARFGVEASDRVAWCTYQLILEISGLSPRRLVQPQTGRTVLFLWENLSQGTWWRARRLPRCQICPERR